jgi:hypothetical protein
MTQAYPLAWPAAFPRRKGTRDAGKFKTPLSAAIANVKASLRLFGADSGKSMTDVVISSNVTLGGLQGADPGVAVWFTWDGMQVCIPVDRYTSVASNLQAIHHVLEARRVELRHGTLALVRATFAGFRALPSPDWRNTLETPPGATLREVEDAYQRLAKRWHPDKGGTDEYMSRLNVARDAARAELGRAG